MTDDATSNTGVKRFKVGTPLLAGVVWIPRGPILTGGADGKLYRVDPTGEGKSAVTEVADSSGQGRVRALVGVGYAAVAGYDTGVSRWWVDPGVSVLNWLSHDGVDVSVTAVGGKVCFVGGKGKSLQVWNQVADKESKTFASIDAKGRLDAVPSARGPRVVWTASDGSVVEVFDPRELDNSNRGSVAPGVKVAAVAPAADGKTIDLIAPPGEFRRHAFPELVQVQLSNAKFPEKVTAHGFAPATAGGQLVAANENLQVHLLAVADAKDDAPVPSTNPVTNKGKVVEVVVAEDGKRIVARVAIAGEKETLFHAAGIDQLWDKVNNFNGRIIAGPLAVSKTGDTLAHFVAELGETRLHMFHLPPDRSDPVAIQKPSDCQPASEPKFLTFWPSSSWQFPSWLLLMTDTNGKKSLRWLLQKAMSPGRESYTVKIHDVDTELTAAPAVIVNGADTVVASAADGMVRVHKVAADKSVTKLGSITLKPDTALNLSITLKRDMALSLAPPLRVAAVVRDGTGADTVRVWDMDDAEKNPFEIERFAIAARSADAPSYRLGWRGGAVMLATHRADKTLTVELFPITFRGRFVPDPPAEWDRAASLATTDRVRVAVVTDATHTVTVYDPAKAADGKIPRVGSFDAGGPVRAVEVLSESTVAVGGQSGVAVFRAEGDPSKFIKFGEWSAADGCKSLSRVDDSRVLATLTSRDQFLLTVTDNPAGVNPGLARPPKVLGNSVVVGGGGGFAVGVEQTDTATVLAARRVVGKGIESPLPVPDGKLQNPDGKLPAVVAVAWSGGRQRFLGLADGRVWDPLNGTFVKAGGSEQMVRAMAHHPIAECFAYALTLDKNVVHFRSGVNGDELKVPSDLEMEFSAPVTALAYSKWLLATGTADGVVEVWPLASDGLPHMESTKLYPFAREVQSLTFWIGAEGKLLLAGLDRGGEIRVWTCDDTGIPVIPRTFNPSPDLAGRTASLAGEPRQNRVAVASQDGTVFLVTVS